MQAGLFEGTEAPAELPEPPSVPDDQVLPACNLLADEQVDDLAETWRLPAYWLLHIDGEVARDASHAAVRLPYEVDAPELRRHLPADGRPHKVLAELRATSIESGRSGLRVLHVDLGDVPGRPPAEVAVVGAATGLEPGAAPFGAGPQTHYWQPHTVPPPDAFMALVGFSRDTQRAAFDAVAAQHRAYGELARAEREHNRDLFMGMVRHWNSAAMRQTETLDHLAERLTEALAGLRPGQPRDEPAPAAPDNPLMVLAQQGPALIKQISDFLPEESRAEIIAGLVEKFTGGGGMRNELMSTFADATRAFVSKWTGVDITSAMEDAET